MALDDILLEYEEQLEKSTEHLKHELRGVRTGRASPALVENIRVDYYGSMTEIRSIAAISVPEATQILIKPFNAHDLKAIEKAINDAKLPLTPHSDEEFETAIEFLKKFARRRGTIVEEQIARPMPDMPAPVQ